MVRDGLCAVLCAGALLCAGPLDADPAAPDGRLRTQLAVQSALQEGLAHLQKGEHAQAVAVLEAQIPYIDGNRRYLTALRDAYRGYIAELQRADHLKEASLYQSRLAILEPRPDLASARPSPPAAPPSEPLTTPAPMSPAPATPTAAPGPLTPPAPPASVVPSVPTPAMVATEALPAPTAPEKDGKGPAPGKVAGKVEEDSPEDPFSDANSPQHRRAVPFLEKAEQAFAARRYDEAARLFEQAYRTSPSVTQECRERWAYCKLFVAAQQLNRGDGAVPPEVEREVRTALSMSPKLEGFGRELLRKIEERADPAGRVEVRHTPRQASGWAVAETASFRIFHTQSKETAERAARIAERTRLVMTRKWFGEAPATAWSPRCDIYLYPTGQDYARGTGAPAQSPGHSTISLDAGRVIRRVIEMRYDDPNALTGVLPHETTHIVLAGQFGDHHVPRWADEGMAVLSEPAGRIELHLRNLPMHRDKGELFSAGQLMRMKEYPEPHLVGAFYAQSVSLVDFLSKRKDPQTFTRFLRDGLEGGYEAALLRHYGLRSFAELDTQWRSHAFGSSVASTAEKRGTSARRAAP